MGNVMDALTIEPTYRVLLGDMSRFRVMLVGAGGTGSSLALALAGLAYHARQKGIQVELTLVDHDKIQEGNVGRQQFGFASALAGDVHKVSDLALRL
ncbi:MAG: ThiF family adenylyltransferase, partial [Anaerolineae bacterium]